MSTRDNLAAMRQTSGDLLDDFLLLYLSYIIVEWQTNEAVADIFRYRAVAFFSAKANTHIREMKR